MSQFIEFDIDDPEKFDRLLAIFAELKKDKDSDEFRPDETWRQIFEADVLARFCWPTPEEHQHWLNDLRHRIVWEIPTESAPGQRWNFFSMIDSYRNSECELDRCEIVAAGKGRFEFRALAYPYGGVGWMVALIEAFGFKVTGIEDGTGFLNIE